MSPHPLADLSVLDRFKAGPFPPGYPTDRRTFYAPVDDVHGALVYIAKSAVDEIDCGMFGFDDDELAQVLHDKLDDEHISVRLTLDKTQAGGVHEARLLAASKFPSNHIAIGSSEHGAIMHLKMMIIDRTALVTGSTNWSISAETKQDNQLTIEINPAAAAEAALRLTKIHEHMLAKAV